MATEEFQTDLKKGDRVVVVSGKDKGKQGDILQIIPKKSAVLVEKVNMVKRHTKPQQDQEGGIVEKEAPIHISNVMVLDPSTGKGTRIKKKVLEDGRKVRVAAGSGEVLDK
uniref:Large ribosomal subunit protein uL24 n=1 Tax=Magnetococcus massalia (strain MO-1) TaxID=451514 RepID=A0A1S7LKL2_MAGMO|nr:50S ribosomal protein L24 [Candidatus Magnetococcus massalia]